MSRKNHILFISDKAVCLSQGTLSKAEDESICGA